MKIEGDVMIESRCYEKLDNHRVQCHTCHHHCIINEYQRGVCGVRENREGRLYLLNYGKTIAVSIDPIEKKPIVHYLPDTQTYSFATVGCNFHCEWCQNCHISQSPKPNRLIEGYDVTVEQHIKEALKNHCKSISYTYSEPTIFFEYAYDTMVLAKKNHLKNIWVTNGFMSDDVLDSIIPYLDAVNVDIKGFNDHRHMKYCGGDLTPIRHNIERLYQSGIHVELTTLIVPSFNDDLETIREIATFITNLNPMIPWHITRFYPAYKMKNTPPTSIGFLNKAKSLGHLIGVKNIYLGNV
jgi:pyruvate formate lyase activating enzyme